ncbi:endonuclease/exonuclease/phosphatase family protein [Paenibacillus foliorum]|nr:endonuclease/exonuclease/phosphatase family protein [Paenibacillus foliorum]
MKIGAKKLFALLVVLSLSLGISNVANVQANEEEQSQSIRVMSYNIRHGEGNDNKLDINRTANVIRESNAEIVALQEVDKNWSERSDFMDQAKHLGEILGMHYAFAPNVDESPAKGKSERRQYGTAVLSKYPIVESNQYTLPKIEESSEKRGLLETVIDVDGVNVTVYSTHMSIIAGERVVQIKELAKITEEKAGPVIFMGDFNAKPNTFEMRPMFKRFSEAFQGKRNAYTAPVTKPAYQIDYILFNNNFELMRSDIIQTEASDHLPIFAQLQIKAK